MKHTVKVVKIDWLDKDGSEAEVLLEIEGYSFWAFAHPCRFNENEIAQVIFYFLWDDVSEYSIWNENKNKIKNILPASFDRCSYYCYGLIINIDPIIVDCGYIKFNLGDWLSDEKAIGSYVYFTISRLDVAKP